MSTPENSTSQPGFSRTEALLTPKQLKERYLFGIKLQDEHGNEMPPEVIQHHISASLSYLEHKLDIIIAPTEFTEEYDYRAVDYTNFNFIQLKHRPLSSVTTLKAKFPNNVDLVTYPKEWIVLEKEGAQIQLSPVEGTFSGLIVTQGGSYVPLIFGTRDHWPHLFQVKYVAGFCDDEIPLILNEMIGMQAAIRIFEIMGDILHGPGISSESVGLDAASISKQLTASANYSAFSARISGYKEQMKEYIATVRHVYNAIPSIIS